jgi:hypothetical protein
MKLSSPRIQLLFAAMLPALPVQATPEENFVNPLVQGQFQAAEIFSESGFEDKVIGKLESVTLDGKSLLKLISEATEVDFPRGARLLVDLGGFKGANKFAPMSGTTAGAVFVVDRDGNVLVNASAYMLFEFDFNALIYSGLVDFLNDKEKTKNQFPATLRLLFPHRDIDILFRGNCFENFRMSEPNDEGIQRVRGVTRFQGSGNGFFDDERFIGTVHCVLRGNELVED